MGFAADSGVVHSRSKNIPNSAVPFGGHLWDGGEDIHAFRRGLRCELSVDEGVVAHNLLEELRELAGAAPLKEYDKLNVVAGVADLECQLRAARLGQLSSVAELCLLYTSPSPRD